MSGWNWFGTRALGACVGLGLMGTAWAQGATVSFEWMLVGDQGNPGDPLFTFGATGHPYSISKYEVTNDQYVAFLNSVATIGGSTFFNPEMETDARGGITRTGSGSTASPFVFASKPNMGDKPVNFIGFFDAAGFANWLNNGQGSATALTGSYFLLGSDTTTASRLPGARYFVPSEHEWFKAAYYDPSMGVGYYWKFPTQTSSPLSPALATATGDVANPGAHIANYDLNADWGGLDGHVTSIGGAGPLSLSYYGCADMGGNAWEFTETKFVMDGLTGRVMRGGSWRDHHDWMAKDWKFAAGPVSEYVWGGFRVARLEGNPAQSLTLIAGSSSIGDTLIYGVDNPDGTQAPGSIPYLAVAAVPVPTYPHGVLVPGLSMLGDDIHGELLISDPILTLTGPAWQGPGTPAPVSIPIPNDTGIIGATIYVQGLLADTSPGATIPFGLTTGTNFIVQP